MTSEKRKIEKRRLDGKRKKKQKLKDAVIPIIHTIGSDEGKSESI